MIRRSDNRAADALFARVGAASVNAVARRAGMTNFRLVQRKQTADGYLGADATHYEKMYCHGMATYALAEAHGMTATELREVLR